MASTSKYNDYRYLIPEFKFFQEFLKKYPKIQPYRTEWRVFDSKNSIAGTIDMVYKKNNGDLFIFDWKRSTKLVNDIGTVIKSDFDYGFDELSNISNNSYNKYCLQQNLYKYILEDNYGKKHFELLESLSESIFDEIFKNKKIKKIKLKIEKLDIIKETTSVGIEVVKTKI